MAYKTHRDKQDELEVVMNQLAESVLELSDDEILAEIRETGADPDEVAQRTRVVLLRALQQWEEANKRFHDLGCRTRQASGS